MPQSFRHLVLFYILSISAFQSFSQSKFEIFTLDRDKGITSPVTLSFRPDRGNLIWIGTYDGLYCFDGFQAYPMEIRHYSTKELITGSIDAIFQDSKGIP